MRKIPLVLLLCAPALASAQEATSGLPPAIAAFAAEQSNVCAAAGGAPRVGPAFATAVDLNGDAALDYIVDLAGIECANAWSAFCGSAGCPLSVWITGGAGPVQQWGDYAQGWRIDGLGAEVAVVVDQHGGSCPGSADGADTCSQRLVFAAPEAPAAASSDAAPEPAAEGETESAPVPRAAPAEALETSGVEGWTLRAAPDGTSVAVTDGPGEVATVAVFCLGGQPWLAARLREPPAAETAELAFAFAEQTVSSAARREDSAGGALIVELAGRPLAGLLSGRDSSTRVSVGGVEQGVLSLRGSTRTIRGALAACMPL